jgi:transcriptional repressor NrdR
MSSDRRIVPMLCPYCGFLDSKVVNSRTSPKGDSIRRRRECLQCGGRFTTHEATEHVPFMVVKKDGTRQAFDRRKIITGLMTACQKRPISTEQIEKLAELVERNVTSTMDREIPSTRIGELVLGLLREIDRVAYVRFASVYRQFHDLDEFDEEIRGLRR